MDNATMEGQWVEEAKRRLKALLADEGVDEHHVTAVAEIGVPGSSIVRYADDQGADLIVMGAQGHGPVHRFSG